MSRDEPNAQSELEHCRRLASAWTPILRALAHEERLLIALWLAGNTCSVRELEELTGLRQSLVSYHLGELRQAGLVTSSASGRSNRYRLAHGVLDELTTLLGALEPPVESNEAEDPGRPTSARRRDDGVAPVGEHGSG